MRVVELTPHFVESMPERLDVGVLYVSMTFATTMHLCACGCGREVVTPLSPTDWKLCFDGEHVTLNPSVGNWSFPCRSHYWVRENRIRWAASMSTAEVSDLRALDRARKAASLDTSRVILDDVSPESSPDPDTSRPADKLSRLAGIWNWARPSVRKRPRR